MSDRPDRSPDELLGRLDLALRSAPGDEAELVAEATSRSTSRFAASTLHQSVAEESVAVTARVVADGRIGVASGNDLSPRGLADLLGEAARYAAGSPPAEGFRGLPSPEPLPVIASPDDDPLDEPAARAARLVDLFGAARLRGATLHGSWGCSRTARAAANGRGVRAAERTASSELVLIAVDAAGPSGHAAAAARTPSKIAADALAAEALDRARLGAATAPVELPPGRYDVLLDPAAVGGILEWLSYIGFSSRAFEEGSSFLVGKLGERVTGERFTLVDDPTDPSGLPTAFDGEGVPSRRQPLVEAGIGRSVALDVVTAARIGGTPTGQALGARSGEGAVPTHLFVPAGDDDATALLEGLDEGIWIGRFHYLNGFLDPSRALMTGMTRDGAFLVRGGRVVAPVVDLRFTESILEAFSRIDGIGRERRCVPASWGGGASATVPALRIRGFEFTGVSRR